MERHTVYALTAFQVILVVVIFFSFGWWGLEYLVPTMFADYR